MIHSERKASWKRLQELYHAARELPAADRDLFLEYHCAGDDGTRDEIKRLLAATEDCSFLADSFDESED